VACVYYNKLSGRVRLQRDLAQPWPKVLGPIIANRPTVMDRRSAQVFVGSQTGLEVWITGDSSPHAEAGLKELGIKLERRCGT